MFRFIIIICAALGMVVGAAEWLFQRHFTWFASANLMRLLVAGPFLLGLMPLATQAVNRRWLRYISRARSSLGGGMRFLMRLVGLSLMVVGWVYFVMMLLHPMAFQNTILEEVSGIALEGLSAPTRHALWMTPLLIFFSTTAIYLGTILMNGAKRAYLAQRYREPTNEEINGQIVFFRSFAADVNPSFKSGYFESFCFISEEETMASAFAEAGRRVYAIGRPGESLPLLGAHRLYCNDDMWQSRVLIMIEIASIAVIRPEATCHVLWEIGQITSKMAPNKIVLWVPPSANEALNVVVDEHGVAKWISHWQQFCDNCDSLFHGQLAPLREQEFSFEEHGFVGFDRDWRAFVFPTPLIANEEERNRNLIRSIMEHVDKGECIVESAV